MYSIHFKVKNTQIHYFWRFFNKSVPDTRGKLGQKSVLDTLDDTYWKNLARKWGVSDTLLRILIHKYTILS